MAGRTNGQTETDGQTDGQTDVSNLLYNPTHALFTL